MPLVLEYPYCQIGARTNEHPRTNVRPVDVNINIDERRAQCLHDYAVARWMAIDLANGKGLISDEFNLTDQSTWEGVPVVHHNEARRYPLLRHRASVLRPSDAPDGLASYGRLDDEGWIADADDPTRRPPWRAANIKEVHDELAREGLTANHFELVGWPSAPHPSCAAVGPPLPRELM